PGGEWVGLVRVGQDRRPDVVILDGGDDLRGVDLLVRLAGPGQPEDKQEYDNDKQDRENPSAEYSLQIHRRTAPLVSGRSLQTIPKPRRLPARLPCAPASTLGFLTSSPVRQRRG